MANSKLNSMPDYTARLPKTPHDVSQSFGFTTCPGMILPVYFDMLHHGDEIHFSASEFVRLNPLETAALGEIELHLRHFFVPLPVMYTPSSSMFYQTDDLISSLVLRESLDASNFPVFNFNQQDERFPQTFFQQMRTPAIRDGLPIGYSRSLPADQFDCIGKSVFRMFDALRMDPSVFAYDVGTDISKNYPRFTPWFALAYQAIYQLSPHFRNTDRENKVYNYNIDKWYNSGSWSENLLTEHSIFFIKYAQKHKDYFNSVKVSPMGSAVSMLSNPNEIFHSVNDWLNSGATFGLIEDSSAVAIPGDVGFNSSATGIGGSTLISPNASGLFSSTNNIRQLFMIDKLLRIIGRTEKNYESQFLAHYGIKVPHDPIHNITEIGHDMAVLQPQSVISSADTYNGETGSALGEIGGQGSKMLSGRKYNFKAPFHGVFMTVAYIVPRTRYVAGLDKLHQLNSVIDFWQPEFDKKGMQPLFGFEGLVSHGDYSARLGWQFAYEQFKRKYDFVSLAFQPVPKYQNSVNTYSPWFISTKPFVNISADGTVPYKNSSVIYSDEFFVAPTSLNGIMQVRYNPSWIPADDGDNFKPWLEFQTDPFICDFNMYCKKVNGMSATGEPELDC